MKNPKFQIFKDNQNQFRFRLNSKNGEIILASEGYTTKQNCKGGIASVKVNAPVDSRYNREVSKNGKYYFVLNAANNEPIGCTKLHQDEITVLRL